MARVAAAFENADQPPAEPLRGSRAAIGAALLLAAIPLSSVPRYLVGISMSASLCVATAFVVALIAVLWPLLGLRARNPVSAAATLGVACVLSVATLALFANVPLEGFPAGTCADAGNHILYKNRFITTNPKVYEGMVGLYAVVHWLTRLGMDDLAAFRLAWQVSAVACVVLVSAVIVAGASAAATAVLRRSLYAATLLAVAGAAFFVTLPLLHYYQSDGYLSQLFSLVPLTIVAGTYSFASGRLTRVLAIVLSLVLYRFTYLLNSGDLMLCSAIMVLSEWRHAPRVPRIRIGLLALAVCLGLGSVAGYVGLTKILTVPGGFRTAPLVPQVVGLGLLSVVLGSVGPVCGHFGLRLNPSQLRLARFLSLFGAAPTALVAGWLLTGHKPIYYVEKYAFCAIVLGSLAVVPIVLSAAFGLVSQGKTPGAGVAASILVVGAGAGLFGLASSADTYTVWFRERLGAPPYGYLEPHADRAAWRIITNTLRKEHAAFGGFLTPRWPESQFTNAHFIGVSEASRDPKDTSPRDDWTIATYNAIFEGELAESAGHCVFWYENRRLPKHLQERWHKGARAAVDRLQSLRPRSCQTFTPSAAPSQRFAVCNVCFGEKHESRTLALTGELEGFYNIEKDTDGSDVRWTKGDGKLPFTMSGSEAALACDVIVHTVSNLPNELWLDGVRLGDGPRQALGKRAPGPHLLEVRSPSFVPKQLGLSDDGRTLGVRVGKVTLECSDNPTADPDDPEPGVISVLGATYGASCGAAQGNYTQSLADECNGRVDCSYPPADRRGDPFPGCPKDFSAEYRCGDQTKKWRVDHVSQTDHYSVQLRCD